MIKEFSTIPVRYKGMVLDGESAKRIMELTEDHPDELDVCIILFESWIEGYYKTWASLPKEEQEIANAIAYTDYLRTNRYEPGLYIRSGGDITFATGAGGAREFDEAVEEERRTYYDPYGTPYTLVHRPFWDEAQLQSMDNVRLVNINDPESEPITIFEQHTGKNICKKLTPERQKEIDHECLQAITDHFDKVAGITKEKQGPDFIKARQSGFTRTKYKLCTGRDLDDDIEKYLNDEKNN